MTTCPHCNGTGKIQRRLTRRYCICPIGVERQDVEEWANRMVHEVDPDVAWMIYMHGKIAGTNELSDLIQKGTPP